MSKNPESISNSGLPEDEVDFDERWWYSRKEPPPVINPRQHYELVDGVYRAKGVDHMPPPIETVE